MNQFSEVVTMGKLKEQPTLIVSIPLNVVLAKIDEFYAEYENNSLYLYKKYRVTKEDFIEKFRAFLKLNLKEGLILEKKFSGACKFSKKHTYLMIKRFVNDILLLKVQKWER
jgi:hypothetical protein